MEKESNANTRDRIAIDRPECECGPMEDLGRKADCDVSMMQIKAVFVLPNEGETPISTRPYSNQIHKFNFNQLLSTIGEYGIFQKVLIAILFMIGLPSTYQVMIMYFSTLTPPWRCVDNSTTCTSNITHHPDDHARCKMNRTEWYYTEHKSYSLVTQFDLHCAEEWKLHLASSIIFLGSGFGSIVCGWLGDHYGRKIVFLPCAGAVLIFGFIKTFCTNIYQISVCQFVIGVFIPGVQLEAFILISEFVGDKQRALAGIIILSSDPVAWSILTFKAYLLQDWKSLSIVATLPYLLLFSFYKFVPESIAWLHFNGKTDCVKKTARQVAKWNKKGLPEHFEVVRTSDEKKNPNAVKTSPLDLFRKRRDATLSIVQGILWVVTACCDYGLNMAADDLGGGIYRDFLILNLVELPAFFASIAACDRIGRKITSLLPLFSGSIAFMILAFLPAVGPSRYARIALGVFGKFCSSITFNSIYTWSNEIYDLPVRCKGMAWLQIVSRLGIAGAPWIVKGLKPVNSWLPFFALGGLALLGSIVSMWLPETTTLKTDRNNRSVQPTPPLHDLYREG